MVCVPAQNKADVEELSWEIKNELKIFYVKKMEDVLMIAIGGEDDDY